MERAVMGLQALYDAGLEQDAEALLSSDTFYEQCEEGSCWMASQSDVPKLCNREAAPKRYPFIGEAAIS